ncbi:hypothetical protein J3E72DRAFT_399395 [Bipolaris maydis]|nr:hypothetical protein BM1_10917 [Bipolaris maydis]KAJ6192110.1 hypothetical protein J3E72DRAFT_399395 [Bipolaris maydis]KAJ6284339.1 hypothetical protein J3E71DRAFT_172193 [Bipolaris maydis]
MQDQHVTPPSSFTQQALTPPPTDKKSFAQAQRAVALFTARQAGSHTKQESWIELQLTPEEHAELERLLSGDKALSGFTKDKIRYDYDPESYRLVVRMPTGIHELFIDRVEDAIRCWLRTIRDQPGNAAGFAHKVRPARSTAIYFPVDNSLCNAKSKHEPDASFWHEDAQYPGVIVEVSFSQKREALERLAETYLLDSDASVRVVVGLDIGYDRNETSEATLSVWRTQIFHTADGDELRVVKVVADEAFRNKQGEPTNHLGLRLSLSDFACEELTEGVMDDECPEIIITTQELCQYLVAAEHKFKLPDALVKHTIAPRVKKRKRSATPPEKITSSDEAMFAEQEERAAKRAECDIDYEERSSTNSLSD